MTAAIAPARPAGAVWPDDAACARVADPEAFAPGTATPSSPHYAAELVARQVTAHTFCAHCPVLHACAGAADDGLEVGLWGGAMRRRSHATGGYTAQPLIAGAPATRHASSRD